MEEKCPHWNRLVFYKPFNATVTFVITLALKNEFFLAQLINLRTISVHHKFSTSLMHDFVCKKHEEYCTQLNWVGIHKTQTHPLKYPPARSSHHEYELHPCTSLTMYAYHSSRWTAINKYNCSFFVTPTLIILVYYILL